MHEFSITECLGEDDMHGTPSGQQRAALCCILQGEDGLIHAGMVWSSVFYIMAHLQSEIRHWVNTCVAKS